MQLDSETQNILIFVVREAIHRSLLALENAEAIDLDKLRSGYRNSQDKYYKLVQKEIEYTVSFSPENLEEIDNTIVWVMSDAFNRSMGILQKKRAIDRKNLDEEYRGVGSKYYDIVTVEMESCIPLRIELIEDYKDTGKPLSRADESNLEKRITAQIS